DEGDAALLTHGAALLPLKRLIEGSAVRQAGQTVLARKNRQPRVGFGELLLDNLSSGDVAHRSDQAGDLAGRRVAHGAIAGLRPNPVTLAMASAAEPRVFVDAAVKQRSQTFTNTLVVVGMGAFRGQRPHKFVGRIAEHFEA